MVLFNPYENGLAFNLPKRIYRNLEIYGYAVFIVFACYFSGEIRERAARVGGSIS